MARGAHAKGSGGPARDAGEGALLVEVDAFPGHPPSRVDLRNGAPFGFGVVATLGLVALVDRADSAMVGGVLPSLQDYFGFKDITAGLLLSAPSLAALLLVGPAGRLADTQKRKNIIAIVILIWGLLTFGAAAAPTFAAFFLARVLLGIATPLTIPASASITGDLYRIEARTKAFAVLRVMEYLGFPLGVAIGGIVGGIFGWRAAFLVAGIPAVILAGYIALKFREPKRGLADDLTVLAERAGIEGATVLPEEHAGIATAIDPGEPINVEHAVEDDDELSHANVWVRTKAVLAVPTLRWVVFGGALLNAGFSGLFSLATIFFYRTHDLPQGAAAGIAGMLGLIGLLGGGFFASRIGDRYHGIRPGWRITVPAYCLSITAAGVLLITAVNILALQLVVYLIVNILNIIALATLGAAQTDVIPARLRGTGFATAQFLVSLGATFGSIVVTAASSVYIGKNSPVTESQVGDAKRAYDHATNAVKSAKNHHEPQSVIDNLQSVANALNAKYEALDKVLAPYQATGIRWGYAALVILLVLGAYCIFKARPTYEADATRVIEDAARKV